jgi:hypothetical protein
VLSLEDLYDLIEVASVNAHNARIIKKWQKDNAT